VLVEYSLHELHELIAPSPSRTLTKNKNKIKKERIKQKQQQTNKRTATFRLICHIFSLLFLVTAACLVKKKHIPIS
jgi:Na+-transporting methylmalonyl-CoA/oxaloacetate decarboxylase beta subunit